jgi:hypothetical protein
MSSRSRGRMVASLVLLLAAPTAVSAALPSPTVAATAGSLRVTPGEYVGGQRVVFEGDLGVSGRRQVHLELNLSRPGDEWKEVDDFTPVWTESDGSFRFGYVAPAMFGIRMRVASGSHATPAWTFDAKSQDLVMHGLSGLSGVVDDVVVADRAFTFVVDTTADLVRRPDSPSPVFAGRDLTLQSRDEDGLWHDVDTSVTDALGIGLFSYVVVDAPGTHVYRVVQEDWTRGGDQVGWYPSFPVPLTVAASVEDARALSASAVAPQASGSEDGPADEAAYRPTDTASTTASETYRWSPSRFDFGWTYGESLTSPPGRGTHPVGWWLDSSTGTGRAAKHNGGLMIDSQRDNKDGVGLSNGTTSVLLRDHPMTYGRWEVRLRMKSTDTSDDDFRTLVELVPDTASTDPCSDPVITVADVRAHGSGLGMGVVRNGREWKRTEPGVGVNGVSHALAVEVGRRHVTWFLDGRPVGHVARRAAVPRVPLTLRLSMVGDGMEAMNRSQAIFDWMRGFPLGEGEQVKRGARLRSGAAPAC